MLTRCPSSSLRSATIKKSSLPSGGRRLSSRRLVIRAEAVSESVLEARAWIEGWKFKQLKVSSLSEGIVKAAEFLEDTKSVRLAKKKAEEEMLKRTTKVTFTIKKPVSYGNSLKLVGSAPEMGSWNPDKAPPMKWQDGNVWTIDLDLKAGSWEYKVVTYADSGEAEWEQGDNRVTKVALAAADGQTLDVELLVLEEKPKETAAKK